MLKHLEFLGQGFFSQAVRGRQDWPVNGRERIFENFRAKMSHFQEILTNKILKIIKHPTTIPSAYH